MRSLFLSAFIYFIIGSTTSCIGQVLPIKPARTIVFTTTEGSYMDVNVSPNGKTLVFNLLGDLYTVPVMGGAATQLTRGLALNIRPVWSPNGKKIAYISDFSGALHLNVRDLKGRFHIVLGKSDRQLEPLTDAPLWTADGNFISLGKRNLSGHHIDDAELVYSLEGGSIPLQKSTEHPLRFSADAKWMYYIDSGWLCRDNLINKVREKISPLLNKRTITVAVLSPDARWLSYTIDSADKRSLVVEDMLRHTKRVLVASLFVKIPYLPDELEQRVQAYSFSPDSKDIYIGYGGKIHRIDVASSTDQIIPFVAQVKSDLGAFDYHTFRVTHNPLQVKYMRSASESPSGKRLVFMALNSIYIMDLPMGKPHLLAPQPGVSQFQPAWSPDGKWIAYVSWCDTVGGYLWRVPSKGGKPERLTATAGKYQRPKWSPDGKSIAAIRGSIETGNTVDYLKETGELVLFTLGEKQEHVIDGKVPAINYIAFSTDGLRLTYQPYDYGNNDSLKARLVSRDLNGKDQRTVVIGSSSDKKPQYFEQRSISPDGRFAVYSLREDEDLYLIPIYHSIDLPIIFDQKQKIPMIRFASGLDPHWESGSKMLAWTYSNRFYRIDPDKIVQAAGKKVACGGADTGLVKVTVTPDQITAINLRVPTLYGHGIIAIKNVRILTMQGAKVIEHGTVLIKDGRITSVGPTARIQIPKNAKVIKLTGATVMPGMIDMHMHLHYSTANIYAMQRPEFQSTLAYGVTTGRDPASIIEEFGTGELFRSGLSTGPRLFTVGRAIFQYSNFKLDDLDDARAIAQKRNLLGGTVIKQYNLKNRLQKQWLLTACEEAGLNMTNEGNDYLVGNNTLEELSMIKDGSTGVEHNPDWGDVYRDITTFYAKSGNYLGETLEVGYGPSGDRYFNYTYWRNPDLKFRRFADDKTNKSIDFMRTHPPTDREVLDSLVRYPSIVDAAIVHQGGKVTLGSHGEPNGLGAQNTLWGLKMGGLTNMETLQAATITGAKALGMQQDLGSIEVGKIADLLILNKNPLENIHYSKEIKYVMKDGILYDGNTLDEIWPVYKKCPEWQLKNQPKK